MIILHTEHFILSTAQYTFQIPELVLHNVHTVVKSPIGQTGSQNRQPGGVSVLLILFQSQNYSDQDGRDRIKQMLVGVSRQLRECNQSGSRMDSD